MWDLHNNIKVVRAISPVAIGTTGTGQTGVVIDRNGYNSVEFAIAYGNVTATNATIVPTVLEGDTSGALTSAANADLIGTEAAAGIPAGTPRASGVNRHMAKRIGYKGVKRYVRLKLVSTITAGPIVSAVALLGNPAHAPVAT